MLRMSLREFHRVNKEFVSEVFDQVKHLLRSKDTRKFTPVGGVEGVYSMKRLRST